MNKTAIIPIITLILMLTMGLFPMIEPEATAAADPIPPPPGLTEQALTAQTATPYIDVAAYTQWKAAGAVVEDIPLYFDVAKETFPTMSIAVTSIAVQNLLHMLGIGGTQAVASAGNAQVYAEGIAAQFQNNMDNVEYGLETQYMYGNMTNAEIMNRVYYATWQLFEEQKAAGGSYDFDQNEIILDSGVYTDILHHQQNGLKHLTANLAVLNSIGQNFGGDYEDMRVDIISKKYISGSYDYSGTKLATSNRQNVYFSPMIEIMDDGYFYADSRDMYFTACGHAGNRTWQLIDTNDTVAAEITLEFSTDEIKHVTLNVEKGVYKLNRVGWEGEMIEDETNRVYGMVTPTPVDGARIRTVLNIIDLDSNRLLITTCGGDEPPFLLDIESHPTIDKPSYNYHVDYEESTTPALNNPQLVIQYTDSMTAGYTDMGLDKVCQNLQGIDNLQTQSMTQLQAAISSSQAAFNTAITAGEWLDLVPAPHQLLPNSDRFDNMTVGQWEFIYMSWLNGMTEWVESGVIDNISLDNLPASGEAMDLTVQADVYAPNGTLLYDDVVFIPYITQPLTLVNGQNATTDGPTYLIAYGEDGDDINTANPQEGMRWYTIPNGSNISVTAMESNGEPIEEIDLTIRSLYEILMPETELGPAPPQSMSELDLLFQYWYYAVLAFGSIVFLGGIVIRSPKIIVAGLLLALLGGAIAMTTPDGLLRQMMSPFIPSWWPW